MNCAAGPAEAGGLRKFFISPLSCTILKEELATVKQGKEEASGTFWCLSMISRKKKISSPRQAERMVESVLGCKWALAVLGAVRGGVRRPRAMERAIQGVSKKVLYERLRKLERFGILEKCSFAEIPPRVEYRLTRFGERFSALIDGVKVLQRELDGAKRR